MQGGAAMRRGPWMAEEDEVLLEYVRRHGPRDWSSIRSKGLLPRTGKSCRLRWVNKLQPNLKTYVTYQHHLISAFSLCLVTFHRPYVSYYQTYANLRFDEIIQFWHVAWSPRCTRAALMQPWYARNRSFTYLSCLCFWFDRKYRNYTLCQTMQFSVFHHWYSMFSSPFTMLLSFKLYRSCLWISSRVCYKKC